jgi:hypothetical protein
MSSAMREARLLLIDAHIKITPSLRTAIAIHQFRRQQRRRAPRTGLRRVITAEENSSTSSSSEGGRCEVDWSVKCLSHSCSSHVAAHGATVVLLPSNVAASPRAILLEVFLVVDRLLKQMCECAEAQCRHWPAASAHSFVSTMSKDGTESGV